MSFSSQRAIYYLIDQLDICLLIVFIKTPAMCKCWEFDNSKSKETEPKKHQQFDKCNNQERQGLD